VLFWNVFGLALLLLYSLCNDGIDTFLIIVYINLVDVIFANDDWDRLELDATWTARLSQALVKAFRKRMQQIRAAPDEREFYKLRSLRFEKLGGNRQHQHSMRLNDQYRLVLEVLKENSEDKKSKTIKVISIEDYH